MSRILSFAALIALTAACATKTFTYEVEAEVVLPEDVAAELTYPALIEVEWMDEVQGVALLCEAPEGEFRADYAHSIELLEHTSRTLILARVVPWPEDKPCDEELIGSFYTEPVDAMPYATATLFEDDAGFLGGREDVRAESVTLELAL